MNDSSKVQGRKSRFAEAANLHAQCVAAYAAGKDFPTVYAEIIRGHPLVIGIPVQGADNRGPTLRIKLANGQTLVFHSGGFSLR